MPYRTGTRPAARQSPSTARAGVAAAAVIVALGALTGSIASATPAPLSSLPSVTATDNSDGTGGGAGAEAPNAALSAARALADATPGTEVIGPGVIDGLGYTPVLEQSLAANGTGDCSSPVPLPNSFEPACRVHDLGYDLLRVAHRQGAPIPPGLRSDLDTLLGQQMHASCEGSTPCTVMAGIAHTAVHLNTVRQGHGAPVEERLPW